MFRVCTYNVNSIRSRKELLFMWLERSQVDVICLQETKVEERAFPFSDFEKIGYHCYVKGQRAYNGVAICSKLPLQDVFKDTSMDILDKESRIIGGRLGDIWLINVYFPHGDLRGTPKFTYKLAFYQQFYQFLTENFSPEDKIILLGDMNVALEDIDVYDPVLLRDTIGTMEEERSVLRKILEWGFVDTFRYLYPNKVQFTWWDYIGGAVWKDQGMRIDYILVTKPLLPSVRDVYVDMWARKRRSPKPSDHAPVVCLLEL